MKIIELLNKIANDERPEMIKVENNIWRYDNTLDDYVNKYGYYLMDHYNMLHCLDYEVEIIEEEKKIPEKIEPLQKDYMTLDDIKFTFSNSEMILSGISAYSL